MTTVSMESLLNFIHSFSLSRQNKIWLADHLYEEAKGEAKEKRYDSIDWGPANEEEALDAIDRVEEEIQAGDVVSHDEAMAEARKIIEKYGH